MLNKFSRRAEVDTKDVLGAVAPHAGYMYCGETQAHVYESLFNDIGTFVIIGPNHTGQGYSNMTEKESKPVKNADTYAHSQDTDSLKQK